MCVEKTTFVMEVYIITAKNSVDKRSYLEFHFGCVFGGVGVGGVY